MVDLILGDCRIEAPKLIKDASVDLIFTDPPYPKDYHYCYEFLAKEAARVLKPNGFIITYVGPYWKHRVMMTLGEYLDYFYVRDSAGELGYVPYTQLEEIEE